jgi:hypothetical protein
MFDRIAARAWILFLLMFCSQALLPVRAADQEIWQIGAFDKSSGEFRTQLSDYSDARLDPVSELL